MDKKNELFSFHSKEELYIYLKNECYSIVVNFIKQNDGNVKDAEDILHDGFIIICDNYFAKNFQIQLTLCAYFIGICRNLWLKERSKRELCINGFSEENYIPSETDGNPDLELRYSIYWRQFKLLEFDCRKIISHMLKKIDCNSSLFKLGFSKRNFFYKKDTCLKVLYTNIKNDPKYKTIL